MEQHSGDFSVTVRDVRQLSQPESDLLTLLWVLEGSVNLAEAEGAPQQLAVDPIRQQVHEPVRPHPHIANPLAPGQQPLLLHDPVAIEFQPDQRLVLQGADEQVAPPLRERIALVERHAADRRRDRPVVVRRLGPRRRGTDRLRHRPPEYSRPNVASGQT